MNRIHQSWHAPHEAILALGYPAYGLCRELYVRSEPEGQKDWVTELPQPVRCAAG